MSANSDVPDSVAEVVNPAGPKSFARLASLMKKHAQMVQAAEALPTQIEEAHAAVTAARDALADAGVRAISDTDTPTALNRNRHESELAELTERVREAELTEKRLQDQLPALESALQSLDTEVGAEKRRVNSDADQVACDLARANEPALLALVEQLSAVVARIVAALEYAPCNGNTWRGYHALVPPLFYTRTYLGRGEYSEPPNLLDVDKTKMVAARAEIRAQMQPVRNALALAHSHKPYVPHAERPRPYVRKGIEVEFSGGYPVLKGEVVRR